MAEKPSKTLVLVEREGQVSHGLRLFRESPGSVRLLALSAPVMRALTEAGAPHKIPEDYLDAALLNRRGLENYDELEKCGRWLDPRLAALPEPLRLNPVYLHYYRLKLLIDSIGLRIEELAAVFRAERPENIIVLIYADDPLWADTRDIQFMTVDGPVYAAVAPFVAKNLGLKASLDVVPGLPPKNRARPLGRLRSRAGALRNALRLLGGRLKPRGGKPTLWQLGELDHDIPELLPLLRSRFRVDVWERAWHGPLGELLSRVLGRRPTREDRICLREFWADVSKKLPDQPLFTYAGINCFPLVSPVLERLFVEEQLRAAGLYQALRRVIRHARPRVALAINTPLYGDVLASWALRAEGVPVVYVQEGGLYGYCHYALYHYCELSFGDYILAYGRGSADHLNRTRLTPRQKAEALPVGAFRLRRLKRKSAAARPGPVKTVMYVVTQFNHNVRYAPLCYGEREYFRLRRRVLEALLAVPGLRIVYKAVPGSLESDPLGPFLAGHRGRIEATDEPLPRVLEKADAFVLDWPTTSLLELLATPRPVWTLLDRDVTRPIEDALPALRRRARVCLDLASFESELGKIAEPGGEDLADSSFLEAYGTGDPTWDGARITRWFEAVAAGRQA